MNYVHHLILILDGIVKFRCLFSDFDPNFIPKEEDYIKLEHIAKTIIDSWSIEFTFEDEHQKHITQKEEK